MLRRLRDRHDRHARFGGDRLSEVDRATAAERHHAVARSRRRLGDTVGRHLRPAGGRLDRESLLAEVERSEAEPQLYGRFIVEVEGQRAGVMAFEVFSRRSRIADLRSLMLLPDFRGRGIADAAARLLVRHLLFDLDYHRVQLECYGFNERAIRHAERVGFVREGVRRKAYWRHGAWQDGVLFGLVAEDLADPP